MRNFTIKDLDGAGQYLVRTDQEYIKNAGHLSTILYKVGWNVGMSYTEEIKDQIGARNVYSLIAMSDGMILDGYYVKEEGNRIKHVFISKEKLVDYLNNPDLTQEYRFATTEEVVRVAMYQTTRCRG